MSEHTEWPHKCPNCGKDAAADFCTITCKIDYLSARNTELLEACEAAMRIESLWMPPDDPSHDDEFESLAKMRNQIQEAIKKAKGEAC